MNEDLCIIQACTQSENESVNSCGRQTDGFNGDVCPLLILEQIST